jgi:GNAT superfamily N-acetyltransferase
MQRGQTTPQTKETPMAQYYHQIGNIVRLAKGWTPMTVIGLTLDNEVIGIALTYIRYSTWKGPMLYLEDLVIREAHRGKGIGKLLFEKCMKRASDLNFEGMIWQVLDWNEPAIRFYDKYQSTYSGEWLNGKLTKTQIDTFFQSENV